MKQFEIILVANHNSGKIYFREVIQGDSLVELYSKLLLTTARLQEVIDKENMSTRFNDDDIPF